MRPDGDEAEEHGGDEVRADGEGRANGAGNGASGSGRVPVRVDPVEVVQMDSDSDSDTEHFDISLSANHSVSTYYICRFIICGSCSMYNSHIFVFCWGQLVMVLVLRTVFRNMMLLRVFSCSLVQVSNPAIQAPPRISRFFFKKPPRFTEVLYSHRGSALRRTLLFRLPPYMLGTGGSC